MRRYVLVCGFVGSLAVGVCAQTVPMAPTGQQASVGTDDLSEADIARALAEGAKAKGAFVGLSLLDSGQGFLNAMAGPSASGRTGFSVEIYTPITWLRQASSNAAKEYRVLERTDVTPELLAPVLRLVIHPDLPTRVVAGGLMSTSSVQHVVVRDLKRTFAVQPTNKDAFDQSVSNAMGGHASYAGMTAVFALSDLREKGLVPGHVGFFVTIIGSAGEKNFEIKPKHFDRLK